MSSIRYILAAIDAEAKTDEGTTPYELEITTRGGRQITAALVKVQNEFLKVSETRHIYRDGIYEGTAEMIVYIPAEAIDSITPKWL